MALFGVKDKPNTRDFGEQDIPTNRFSLFFVVLGVRFWKLIQLNLLYVASLIPIIVWTLISLISVGNLNVLGDDLASEVYSLLFWYLLINIPCMALAGPPTAGLHFILKKWSEDEHAWVWSDFLLGIKENWKQSMLASGIMGLIVFLTFVAYNFYNSMEGSFYEIIKYVLLVFVGVLALATVYVYPLMVTYNVKFKELYKTSVVLGIARLPFSVIMLVLNVGIWGLMITDISWIFALIMIVIGFAFIALIQEFYCNSSFDKYINPTMQGATVRKGLRKLDDDVDDDFEEAEE